MSLKSPAFHLESQISGEPDVNLRICPRYGTYLVAQLVKNPPVMQETLIRSLGWEDPLEKGMATHSSILA